MFAQWFFSTQQELHDGNDKGKDLATARHCLYRYVLATNEQRDTGSF
jgi:hypothetical protein